MCMVALQVAALAVSAYGAYQQNRAQKTALEAEAAATDRERVAAGERADDQAQRIGAQVGDARGRQQLAIASGGVDIGSETSQATLASTDYYGLQDQRIAARNAADIDFNYRDRSSQLRSSARQIHPYAAAGMSMLSGAGKVASSWYNYGGATS